MSNTVEEIKSVGHIDKLHIDISAPMPMSMQDLEMKNLNVLVGANGVGKSFLLVTAWVFSHLATMIGTAMKMNMPLGFEEACQFVFDTSFRSKNITGTLACTFKSGANITCILVDGKIKAASHAGFQGMTDVTTPVFMSSAMRRFESMMPYLRIRKTIQQQVSAADPEIQKTIILGEMLKSYALYDVMYLEGVIAKMPKKVSPQDLGRLKTLGIEENILEIGVDLDHCDFYVILSDRKQYISTWFGSGHQSLLNMFMAQII